MTMSVQAGIDPDLLRAFVFIAEEGSFTRAAERVGRTQSAVSMQMQRLEQMLGQRLLARGKGGSVGLTPHGRSLLAQARDLLEMHDRIWSTFRAPAVSGTVRLGTPDDYAMRYLPPILRRFADTHPAVEVEVLCQPSDELAGRLMSGDLDLTLLTECNEPPDWPRVELWRGPLVWVTAERHAPHRLDPLPLALAHAGCTWRRAAIRVLEAAGRRHRIAFVSGSQAGTHAPVLAGLAVTVSALGLIPPGLRPLRADEGLPPLPDFGIMLLKGRAPRQPVTDVLARHIEETFRQEADRSDRAA
jgi:DNA-binding transcriptional LysR family regulator